MSDNQMMRDWQRTAYETYMAANLQDFLLVATPGAGKTLWSVTVGRSLLPSRVSRFVVVVPSQHLKTQWADKAHEVGLRLDPDWDPSKGGESEADFDGVVVTYQAVRTSALMHRNLASRRNTLVVFDEIHHAGEDKAWGDALRQAFEPAVLRLALSGTPFRSDNNPIPFVRYSDVNESVADFTYGYADALREGVCRPVIFLSYGGTVEFLSGGNVVTASIDEQLDALNQSRKLRTTLDTKGEWMKTVLTRAHEELTRIRQEEQKDAGGLVIAMNQEHAWAIADQLKTITGVPPILAVSDVPGASDLIQQFTIGRAPWIVAVKMVSEGVDIPRLRVAVYATNIISELFFRQAVGRLVRMQERDGEDQTAYCFIPDDPRLTQFAQAIMEERTHALRDIEQEVRDWLDTEGEPDRSAFLPISSEAEESDAYLGDGVYSPEELEQSRKKLIELGFTPTTNYQVLGAAFIRDQVANSAGVITIPQPTRPDEPIHRQKRRMRQVADTLSRQFAGITQTPLKDVNMRLGEAQGWVKIDKQTLAQLGKRVQLLNSWIDSARRRP